jgi:hypothetical protein
MCRNQKCRKCNYVFPNFRLMDILVGVGARRKQRCELDDYIPKGAGERVLSCGEGEQLGHPGRTTTRKPRALDTLPAGTEIIQVNFVHSTGGDKKRKVQFFGVAL